VKRKSRATLLAVATAGSGQLGAMFAPISPPAPARSPSCPGRRPAAKSTTSTALYGSGHTPALVTADREKAECFMNLVDSADVFWNVSSHFSDGHRYGLTAQAGISTNKIRRCSLTYHVSRFAYHFAASTA